MKRLSKVVGQVVFLVGAFATILVVGGGTAFLRRPVAALYLVLSAAWWSLAMARRRGVRSQYDGKQEVVLIGLGIITVPLLLIGPVWEYARFTGPLPRDGTLSWVGLVLFATGMGLQVASMRALGTFFTVRLGVEPQQRLVTSGPYRLVRHPAYLSYILSVTGIGLALSSLIALAVAALMVPFLLWRIIAEERMLLAEFGEEYREYVRRTRRLVPWVY